MCDGGPDQIRMRGVQTRSPMVDRRDEVSATITTIAALKEVLREQLPFLYEVLVQAEGGQLQEIDAAAFVEGFAHLKARFNDNVTNMYIRAFCEAMLNLTNWEEIWNQLKELMTKVESLGAASQDITRIMNGRVFQKRMQGRESAPEQEG